MERLRAVEWEGLKTNLPAFDPGDTVRTMTRTVSPGSNAGRLVLRPSRSTALSRSIRSPSILITRPQIGPPFACQPLGLRRPPGRDLLVVTAQQYRRDIHSAIARRPRVARRGEQTVVMRVARRRLMIAQRLGEQPHHGVEHAQRRRLPPRQHEVAERQLLGA